MLTLSLLRARGHFETLENLRAEDVDHVGWQDEPGAAGSVLIGVDLEDGGGDGLLGNNPHEEQRHRIIVADIVEA